MTLSLKAPSKLFLENPDFSGNNVKTSGRTSQPWHKINTTKKKIELNFYLWKICECWFIQNFTKNHEPNHTFRSLYLHVNVNVGPTGTIWKKYLILTNGIWNLAIASEKGFSHTTELTPTVTITQLTGVMISRYHDCVYWIFERSARFI